MSPVHAAWLDLLALGVSHGPSDMTGDCELVHETVVQGKRGEALDVRLASDDLWRQEGGQRHDSRCHFEGML